MTSSTACVIVPVRQISLDHIYRLPDVSSRRGVRFLLSLLVHIADSIGVNIGVSQSRGVRYSALLIKGGEILQRGGGKMQANLNYLACLALP